MPEYTGTAAEEFGSNQEVIGPNFVTFTTTLITNVMETIVDSGIKQLKAYGDFVKDVSGTVAEYQLSVAGLDTNSAFSDASNVDSLNAFALDVLGLTLDLQGGSPSGTIALNSNGNVHANILNGIPGAKLPEDSSSANKDKTIEDVIIDGTGAPATSIDKADLGEFIFEYLKNKTKDEYDLLKFIIAQGMNQVIIDSGSITTKVDLSMSAFEGKGRTETSTDTQAKGWSWNAGFSGRRNGWKKGVRSVIGGYANGGMYNHSLSVKTVNTSDLTSTNVNASMFGEVKFNFSTYKMPPAKLGED